MITVAEIKAAETLVEALITKIEATHGPQKRLRHLGHSMLAEAERVTGLVLVDNASGVKPA